MDKQTDRQTDRHTVRQTDRHCQLWFGITAVFDGTPRTRIDITATVGALDGEASSKGV